MRYSLVIVAILAAGCGKVGEILKPAPKPVADIATAKAVMAGSFAYAELATTPGTVVPGPKPGEKCPVCNGTGKVGDGKVFAPCGSCKGTGKVLPSSTPPFLEPAAPTPMPTAPPVIPPTPIELHAPEPPRSDAPPVIDDKIRVEISQKFGEMLQQMTELANGMTQFTESAERFAQKADRVTQELETAAKPVPPPVDLPPPPAASPPKVQEPAKPASLFDLIVNAGRKRRVILITDTKTCIVCKTKTKPEMESLLATAQWVLGPSTIAHVEIIDIAVDKHLARYNNATPDQVAAALGFKLDAYPLYILIDNGKVVRHSNYNGPDTAKNLLLKG